MDQRLNRIERKLDESLQTNGARGSIGQPATGDEAS
jgi:hypothetical protein